MTDTTQRHDIEPDDRPAHHTEANRPDDTCDSCGMRAYTRWELVDINRSLHRQLAEARKEITHLRHCNTTLIHTQSEEMAQMVIERERLERQVERLRAYADMLEDDLHNFYPDVPNWSRTYECHIAERREDAGLIGGDLGSAPERHVTSADADAWIDELARPSMEV